MTLESIQPKKRTPGEILNQIRTEFGDKAALRATSQVFNALTNASLETHLHAENQIQSPDTKTQK